MSGFSPQEVLDRFSGKGLNGFIQKPFLAKDLLEALRKMLDVPADAGPNSPGSFS